MSGSLFRNLFSSVPSPAALRPVRMFLAAAVLGTTLSGQVSAAVPCSYGENFNFADATPGGASKIGTMINLDIDREPATVTVTRTGGGNLPSQTRGGSNTGAGVDPDLNNPGISASSTSPVAYGCPLYLTSLNGGSNVPASDNTAPLTFTFSKSMRNLVMHFNGGDNRIFTFTDGNGQPLAFTIRYVGTYTSPIGNIPQTGTGSGTDFFKQLASNQVTLGVGGAGSIAFKNPVSVIRMTQEYIGNTHPELTGGNFNTSTLGAVSVNFGQYCDQPGVIDFCNNMNFALWETPTYSASVNPDAFAGRIIDETGKVITVNFSGALQQAGTVVIPGFENAGGSASGTEGNFMSPFRPTTPMLVTNEQVAADGTITMSWTFGEEVRNPGLFTRGTYGNPTNTWTNLRFYKADGVTPLPFLLRNPAAPQRNRQVDSNTLFVSGGPGSTLQFIGNTTGIVLKVTRSAGTGNLSYFSTSTVFLGCNGVMTASGSEIDADTDGDGVPDITDKCPNTPAGAVVGADGCPLPTDLSVVKTASVSKITPGVPFTYTITVTNTGAEATNVKASDLVPAGLTINSTSASDSGVVTQNGQAVQALWSIVPNGGVRTLTITVTKP